MSDNGSMGGKFESTARRASQGPISTNYFRRKEELEAINRENLRINMKIVTVKPKIDMTRKNRKSVET